jgi:TetR/AcrR family acrAB operon transcriptional repressor
MARKTKAEAAQTRERIIDCARQVFSREGVTNTSLEEVAREAGVTRGAVYWHFQDKADLFMAVRRQTGVLLRFDGVPSDDPLLRLEAGLQGAFRRLSTEPAAQETYEMMLWKCEYIGEFANVRQELMTAGDRFLAETTELYAEARRQKLMPADLDPRLTAQETYCFYVGMLKLWLADQEGGTIRRDVSRLISRHVEDRRRRAGGGHKAV